MVRVSTDFSMQTSLHLKLIPTPTQHFNPSTPKRVYCPPHLALEHRSNWSVGNEKSFQWFLSIIRNPGNQSPSGWQEYVFVTQRGIWVSIPLERLHPCIDAIPSEVTRNNGKLECERCLIHDNPYISSEETVNLLCFFFCSGCIHSASHTLHLSHPININTQPPS